MITGSSVGTIPVTYPTLQAFALPLYKDKQRESPR